MRATITSTCLVGVLSLGAWAMLGSEAGAQGKPDSGRPEAGIPNLQGRPTERAPLPQRPDQRAPSEDMPSAQDEMPAVPGGCPDQGRKLQLIV